MKNYFLRALLYTLLSAVVIAQKPVPKELDYEEDLPLQPGGGGPFSRDVPVFVNVHSHPKTGFSCADKQAGQYYADPESKCAVYYVCIANERGSLSAQSFACPNGTLFSQSTRVCAYHDLVYCQLSERYYDAVHGNIDSKGQEDLYKPAPLQPWRKPQSSRTSSLRPPQTADDQPSSPAQPQPRPQSQPQSSTRLQPQPRPQPPRAQPQPTPVASAPAAPAPQNSRRSQFGPPAPAAPSSTTPAPAPSGPVEYEYEYVDYALPNDTIQGRPAVNPPVRSKREAPSRRKGQTPSPFEFLSAPHIITAFKCEDKVPGIAYADEEAGCRMFHVCIPFSKGKLRDYQLYCEGDRLYNQETGACEPRDQVNCARSQKFYVYNKWFRPQESRKDSWKKYIKKNAKKSS